MEGSADSSPLAPLAGLGAGCAARMPKSEKNDQNLERSRRILAGSEMAECPSSLDAKRGGGKAG